jgi:hypothetical protein
MPVIINEFKIEPLSPPQEPPGATAPAAEELGPPTFTPLDIESVVRRREERRRRLWAH